MSTISLKGERGDDPWLTVDYANADDLRERVADLMGDEAPQEDVSIPHLIALAQAWYRAHYALSQVVAPAVQSAAPANVTPISAAPSAQAAPAAAPVAAGAPLPDGVELWTGPNPEKPQYTELFIKYPYNQTVTNLLKQQVKPLIWNAGLKVRLTNPKNEGLVRQILSENAHLFV